jgi:hypothetical protein
MEGKCAEYGKFEKTMVKSKKIPVCNWVKK